MFKRESRSACLGTKKVPRLQRVDLSFMNSVTGSSNIAKCSNFPQDKSTIIISAGDLKYTSTPSKVTFEGVLVYIRLVSSFVTFSQDDLS